MSTTVFIVGTTALMIALTALYVGAEFAAVAARKTRISQMAAAGNRLARMMLPFMEDRQALDRYIAACQIGITLASLVLGAYGQSTVAPRLVGPIAGLLALVQAPAGSSAAEVSRISATIGQPIAATFVLILFTVLQVVLGELFPKSLAIQYPEKVVLATAVPMRWSLFIFRPFIWFFNGSGNLILRLLGLHRLPGHAHVHSPEEIEVLVSESHQGGLLDDEERQLLRNAFRMRDLTARQVMVHRTRLVAAPVDGSVLDLLRLATEEGLSRIPLYEESIDRIIGFVHIKDLFRLHSEGEENLAGILRQVVYVPETLPVADVWETLSSNRQYMAIVFDEFGGTSGLITFEDLIEEIFGELQDEFDQEVPVVTQDKDGRIYLRGDLLVTDVNEYLDLKLPDEAADTLGGLVLSELGYVPEVGDEVTVGNAVIRVEAMEDMGIIEVSLQAAPDNQATGMSDSHLGEWEIFEHE